MANNTLSQIAGMAVSIEEQMHDLSAQLQKLADNSKVCQWHHATEIPQDGFYIVCTQSGSVYVSQPLGGKWMSQVKWWMELPILPDELRNK